MSNARCTKKRGINKVYGSSWIFPYTYVSRTWLLFRILLSSRAWSNQIFERGRVPEVTSWPKIGRNGAIFSHSILPAPTSHSFTGWVAGVMGGTSSWEAVALLLFKPSTFAGKLNLSNSTDSYLLGLPSAGSGQAELPAVVQALWSQEYHCSLLTTGHQLHCHLDDPCLKNDS